MTTRDTPENSVELTTQDTRRLLSNRRAGVAGRWPDSWAAGIADGHCCRAAARSWSWSPTLKTLPSVLAVQRLRRGQPVHRGPKVAEPFAAMVTVIPFGQVTVRLMSSMVNSSRRN